MSEPQLTELAKAIAELREADVEKLVSGYLEKKHPPLEIIGELSAGMEVVGSRFKQGEYYLSELVFSGQIFKNAMAKLKPVIDAAGGRQCVGKVVLGTVKGDIHDLGKDIVAMLLECAGFEVINLGTDVMPQKFVEVLRESKAPLLGLSGLITTAFDSMKETVHAVMKAGLRDSVKIMIGGGPTNEEVKTYVGADFYGRDAAAAVDIAKKVMMT